MRAELHDGQLRLTVLGSGTAIPVRDRFPAGYLVQSKDSNVLIDCGPGTLRRLAETGVDLDAIDAVLLTHYHTDHCADLAALLFALLCRALPPPCVPERQSAAAPAWLQRSAQQRGSASLSSAVMHDLARAA